MSGPASKILDRFLGYPGGNEGGETVNRFLDKNENPFDLPELLKKSLLERLSSLPFNRYPDPDYTALRNKLADYCGFPASSIVPGNGGDEILWMAFSRFTRPGDKVLCFSPTFSEYYRLAELFRVCLHTIPADLTGIQPRFDYNLFLMRSRELKPVLVLLDTPNNPTGHKHPSSFIGEVAEFCESNVVVVDEAYAEFSSEPWLSSIRDRVLPENVIVLRTLSKAWGLAGLRLGYAVCGNKAGKALKEARAPFNVNILSGAAAEIVLENTEEMRARVSLILDLRDKFTREVNGIAGWKAFDSEANFVLVRAPLPWRTLSEATGGLRLKRFPLTPESEDSACWLRVSVGTQEDMDAVIEFFSTIQRR